MNKMIKKEKLLLFQIEAESAYLAKLFFKSGKTYSATRPKINHLLVINSLCNIDHPELLDALYIDEEEILIPIFYNSTVIYRDCYINYKYNDDKKRYIGNFDADVKVPKYLDKYISLTWYPFDKITTNLLEEIFREFASYKSSDLGEMLHELIPLIKNKDLNFIDRINYENTFKNNSVKNQYKNNKIFMFISNYVSSLDKNIIKNSNQKVLKF